VDHLPEHDETPPEETPGSPAPAPEPIGRSKRAKTAETAEPPEQTPSPPATPDARAEQPAPAPRRRRIVLAVAIVLGLVVLYGLVELITWPDVAALADKTPETTAFIARWEHDTGKEARWTWVPYARISPHLKRAVLVSEDINFFSHHGFDTDEIENALETAWQEKHLPRGASTLTQQLAKNLWLSPSRNPLRKLKEAILTRQLEERLSKRRILELYLNVVELGPGIYGAEAAARHYFGVSAAALGPRQAAELAAALPNPAGWHPGAESRRYRNRVATVLRRMAKAQFLWKEI